MKEIQNHPLAEIFPMLGSAELKELSEDINKNGLENPIVLYEEKILDGRNRYAACKLAGVEGRFVTFEGPEPLQYILSLNLHRRHLSESQRAMVAAKIANIENGGDRISEQFANLRTERVSQPEAAKLLNVSERSVQAAKAIIKKAPEKAKEIERGEKTINRAVQEIKEKEKPHPSVTVDKGRERAIQYAINAINELKKIPAKEKARPEALKMVKNWINQN